MIKGTGLDHNGLPVAYVGRGGNKTADGATSNSDSTGGRTIDGRTKRSGTTGRGTTGDGTDDGCLSNTTL